MTRAAPFGLNKVVFLSHVVRTSGRCSPARRDAAGWRLDHRRGNPIRGGSGSLATVFGLIP